MEEEGIEIPFLCSPCRSELPKIRELLNIQEKHDNLKITVDQLIVKVDNLKKEVKDAEAENINIKVRVAKLESIIEEKKLNSEDFPPLEKLKDQSKQFSEIVKKQQTIDDKLKRQSEEKIEEK